MNQAVSSKKTIILTILAILLCVLIGIGFSYAVWNQTEKQTNPNLVESGCFEIELTDEENVIDLKNQFPITDDDGKKLTPYTFTVKNNCSVYASYSVNLEKLFGSDLDNQYIKVMLNNKRPQLYSYYSVASNEETNSIESRTLTTDGLEANKSKTYELRIWIDENATNEIAGGKTFNSKIVVSSVASYQSGAEYIASLLESNQETMINDDPDENVRYIGATPNNYVTFNDEPWRIIGAFDMFECEDDATVETYTTKCSTKKLLKIIRNESIGAYSWDSSDPDINNGYGINEWSTSVLSVALNTAYYSSTKGVCYGERNKVFKECDFTEATHNPTKGLSEASKNQIAKVMWNTGTIDGTTDTYLNTNTEKIYEAERSKYTGKVCTTGTDCNDLVERTSKWVGKIGLMYTSDYAYATSGSNYGKTRDECLTKELYMWRNKNEYEIDCAQNSWLLYIHTQQVITPLPMSSDAYYVLNVNSTGFYGYYYASYPLDVRPVVYLKSDVKIIHDDEHDGSSEHPYGLSM